MKISASLYSAKNDLDLPLLVQELDQFHVDLIHIDCLDDMAVFQDIAAIRRLSDTPIDLHIISDNPDKFWSSIIDYKIEYVSFQYEQLKNKFSVPNSCESKIGLSVVSNTSLEVFSEYADVCSFLLMMTTTPGQSGKPFQKDNFKRIYKFRQMFPGKKLHVDGGINDEISFILRNLGVDCAVSGSYLMRHESIGSAMLKLKSTENKSSYTMQDFMIDLDDLPILNLESANFEQAVRAIDHFKLGFCFYTDEEGHLKGITSNADLRRGIIKQLNSLDSISLNDIVNYDPVVIRDSASIEDMLQLIKGLNFIILFLPVIDNQGLLKGAVTFNNLIRGE